MGKENTAIKTQVDRVFRTIVDQIMHGPPATSWSATMPPYCYTELCPDPEYRRPPDLYVGDLPEEAE